MTLRLYDGLGSEMNFVAKHMFGIMQHFEENKLYCEYEAEKYNCVPVDMHVLDYVVDNYLQEWGEIKTFLSISSQTFYGLDENAITIIPPESLSLFRNIVIDANSKIKSNQLIDLISMIDEAIQNNKHLIHFGI